MVKKMKKNPMKRSTHVLIRWPKSSSQSNTKGKVKALPHTCVVNSSLMLKHTRKPGGWLANKPRLLAFQGVIGMMVVILPVGGGLRSWNHTP